MNRNVREADVLEKSFVYDQDVREADIIQEKSFVCNQDVREAGSIQEKSFVCDQDVREADIIQGKSSVVCFQVLCSMIFAPVVYFMVGFSTSNNGGRFFTFMVIGNVFTTGVPR